jgi:SET domain-containing protein
LDEPDTDSLGALALASNLIVKSSDIHAAGCYTTRPIRKGHRICEYTGPRLPKPVADERYADRFVTYLFGYGSGDMVIDGFGTPMFMNHCCEPNCETIEDDERIFVVALRDIAADEELVYEYNLWDADDSDQTCFCGKPSCRRTMLAPGEVERREKDRDRPANKA